MNFSTPFSTNAISICEAVGIEGVKRIEQSMIYFIRVELPTDGGDYVDNLDKSSVISDGSVVISDVNLANNGYVVEGIFLNV